ncbi:MAG: DUF4349 domain-containing protein [Chloroflexi bacterium]|nr:DUF4349 domain-containing protein [Chloroflexota bacterium]
MRARHSPLALLLLALTVLLAACGGAPAAPPSAANNQADAPRPAEAARSAPAAGGVTGGAAVAKPGAPAPAPTAAPAAATAGRVAGAAGQLPALEQKIIRTGKMEMIVAGIPTAIDRITVLVAGAGGFVQQMATREATAEMLLRVPVDQYDAVFRELRSMAVQGTRVIESSEAQDVTEQFADTEARITNLKATEAQLLKLLAKAEKMEDILVVQREITGVREQIERLQGQLNVLSRRAAFSTIAVTLRPQEEARPPAAPPLMAPLPSAASIAVRPTFTWGASPGATAYELQVATEIDTTFTTPLLPPERLTATSFEWPAGADDLRQGAAYRWRVRAVNAAGEGDWAGARLFTTVPAWTPLRTVTESWAASLVFLQRFVDGALRVVIFFWWLIVLAVLAVVLLRRFGRPLGRRPNPPAPPPVPPAG